MTLFMANHN